MLSRKGDKATNPAAAIKGEKSITVLLRIAKFAFNTIKEEKNNRIIPNIKLYGKDSGEYETVM